LNRLASVSAASSGPAIETPEQPSQQNIISVGIFSIVHRLSDTVVRKVPSPSNNGDFPGNCEAIRSEARIYNLLGTHPRIAECLSKGQTEDFVDLYYYANGTLLDYIKKNGEDTLNVRQRRWQWGRQIIEAIVLIHKHNVIHSDLALRQYLLDDHLDARLSDFGASAFPGHNAFGFENTSHCLPRDFNQPNTVQSDLFALGSTLYELGTGKDPYWDICDDEIIERYTQGVFPDVSSIFCGEIILQCWKTDFASAQQVLLSYQASPRLVFEET
jgi:serine/threonine protein kinase